MCNNKNFLYLRKQYNSSFLRKKNLPKNPLYLLKSWIIQACKNKLILEPNAMSIATVDKNGTPYQRTVLLKSFDKNGMVFFTNLKSRKANHLKNNSYISLLFFWDILERQIMIIGNTTILSQEEVSKYFYLRPRKHQISAWASKQSQKIKNRNILEDYFCKIENKFKNEKKIPIPKFWGGYRVKIKKIEFWQGRKYRLHDRFIYQKIKNQWILNRLSP